MPRTIVFSALRFAQTGIAFALNENSKLKLVYSQFEYRRDTCPPMREVHLDAPRFGLWECSPIARQDSFLCIDKGVSCSFVAHVTEERKLPVYSYDDKSLPGAFGKVGENVAVGSIGRQLPVRLISCTKYVKTRILIRIAAFPYS